LDFVRQGARAGVDGFGIVETVDRVDHVYRFVTINFFHRFDHVWTVGTRDRVTWVN